MSIGVRFAAALVVAVLLCGCTDEAAAPLPPLAAEEVAPIYADELAELGLVLTDRGGLVDAQTYEPDPDGTHLSLYVAPVGDRPDEAYVDGLASVTAVFARDVFDRWPELESFDVCQEAVPTQGADSAPARTQVTLTREAARSVDWSRATVDDVATATGEFPESFLFVLDDTLRASLSR